MSKWALLGGKWKLFWSSLHWSPIFLTFYDWYVQDILIWKCWDYKKKKIPQSESFYFFCCKICMNWATELCLVAFDQIFAGLFRGHLFLYVLCDNLATIQENMPDSYFGQDSNSCTLKNFSSVIQKRQISPWRVQ